jgi:hypothetical protein
VFFPPFQLDQTNEGSVAKLIVTFCYQQLVVFFVLEHFNIWYRP